MNTMEATVRTFLSPSLASETDIELATRIGTLIRQRAVDVWRQRGYARDLTGACGICTYWLWRCLEPLRRGTYIMTVGTAAGRGHAWLELRDGTVIDLTATQFWNDVPDIAVMKPAEARGTRRRYLRELTGRKCRLDFNSWYPEYMPMVYSREFARLVRGIVREERKRDKR